jgi:hypothetical protein
MSDEGRAATGASVGEGIDVVLPTGGADGSGVPLDAANAPEASSAAPVPVAAAAAEDSESRDFLAAAARASASMTGASAPTAEHDLAAAAKARKASILEHEAGAPGAEVPTSLEAFVNANSKLPAAANPATSQQQHTVPVVGKTKATQGLRRKDSFGKGGEGKQQREKKRPPATPGFMSETWPPAKPTSTSKGIGGASHRKKDGGASHRVASPRASHRGGSPVSPRAGGGVGGGGGAPSAGDKASGWNSKESPRSPRASTPSAKEGAKEKKGGGGTIKSEDRAERKKARKAKTERELQAAAQAEAQNKPSQDFFLPTFLTHLLMHEAAPSAPAAAVSNDTWTTCDLSDGFISVAECLEATNTSATLREVC